MMKLVLVIHTKNHEIKRVIVNADENNFEKVERFHETILKGTCIYAYPAE